MTAQLLDTSRQVIISLRGLPNFKFWRLLIFAFISIFYFLPHTRTIVTESMQDAFFGVSVFVLATLATIMCAEKLLNIDFNQIMKNASSYQVFLAGILGATPGCGGAIVVTMQYAKGYVSFGSLIATLTATMGDAAFLLLVREPTTGLLVIVISLIAGISFGYLVDYIKGVDYLRNENCNKTYLNSSLRMLVHKEQYIENNSLSHWISNQKNILSLIQQSIGIVFVFLFVPGFIIGVLWLAQWSNEDIALFFAVPPTFIVYLAVCAMFFMLCLWTLNIFPDSQNISLLHSNSNKDIKECPLSYRLIGDACLISVLVMFAFVLYELILFFSGFALENSFKTIPLWLPAMAIAIGFIPGCGPQIVVTSLYLSGILPFAALIGNSISNDGDALFPALAIAPKASIIATLYTAIPALIIAYGWYFLIEV